MAVVELKVGVHCQDCAKAIKKAIKKLEEIETYKVERELNKVTVTGNVTVEEVARALRRIGKHASDWNAEN
ncbi:unnamed protein product [Spirodela intermedia]|uniref:HMA domain-containing protein n=2 Tax=Spirodela intermedia TaxID=51605 RepID=A0A7I8K5X1_SPIIN|nr:unnamed protein product [Spirodela intermedia]CAA6656920.1 unnamed protein product [Spirodela intermedia]CAA7392875.1 unnamed protein product [Spirodela intermedia]